MSSWSEAGRNFERQRDESERSLSERERKMERYAERERKNRAEEAEVVLAFLAAMRQAGDPGIEYNYPQHRAGPGVNDSDLVRYEYRVWEMQWPAGNGFPAMVGYRRRISGGFFDRRRQQYAPYWHFPSYLLSGDETPVHERPLPLSQASAIREKLGGILIERNVPLPREQD